MAGAGRRTNGATVARNRRAAARGLEFALREIRPAPGARMAQRKAAPQIGLVMGSDSDWDVMKHAARELDAFAVAYEARVLSAHRMAPYGSPLCGASASPTRIISGKIACHHPS